MAKKTPLLSPPSNVQLAPLEVQKPYKGAGMIIFSWINAQNIFFQLPNLKNYIAWGVEVVPAY